MNVEIEALKNKQGKFILCRLEVENRPIFYYHQQKKPHRTHRWMSTEQWLAYNRQIQQLLSINELENLSSRSLIYTLPSSICLELTKSTVSKNTTYEALNNKNINLDDVVNVIDCKILYQGYVATNSNTLGTPIKSGKSSQDSAEIIAETPITETPTTETPITETPITSEENGDILSCDSSPHKGFISPEREKIKNDNNVFMISPSENSPLTPVVLVSSQESIDTPLGTAEQTENKLESDDINDQIQPSPTFPKHNTSTSPVSTCDKILHDIESTESSDIAENIFLRTHKKSCGGGFFKGTSDHKKGRSPKKHALKEVNENEKQDSDIEATPPERRKRKLYNSSDKSGETQANPEPNSPKHKQPRTEESRKTLKPTSSQHKSSSSSSSSKKKKSKRERSKTPEEKNFIHKWLGKSDSKDEEKTSKSAKHSSSRSSSSSSRKQNKHDDNTPKASTSEKSERTTPKKKSKLLEKTLSNEEKLKLIEESEKVIESDRQIIKSMKELIPKKPKRPIQLNLLEMSADEMLATYEQYSDELAELFKAQKAHKKFTIMDGVNHNFVTDLVDNKVQQKLMEKLSEFEKVTDGTPRFGDLFSNVLMPEWILRIFMNKFDMNRAAAVKHIRGQNEFNALNAISNYDLDKMAKKKK